jgi:hypothetical protein
MDYIKQIETLKHFKEDCKRFWEREGYDTRTAELKALEDILQLETDPNSPTGEKLSRFITNRWVNEEVKKIEKKF